MPEKRVILENRGFVIVDSMGWYFERGDIFSEDLQDAMFIEHLPSCLRLNPGYQMIPAKKLRGKIILLEGVPHD